MSCGIVPRAEVYNFVARYSPSNLRGGNIRVGGNSLPRPGASRTRLERNIELRHSRHSRQRSSSPSEEPYPTAERATPTSRIIPSCPTLFPLNAIQPRPGVCLSMINWKSPSWTGSAHFLRGWGHFSIYPFDLLPWEAGLERSLDSHLMKSRGKRGNDNDIERRASFDSISLIAPIQAAPTTRRPCPPRLLFPVGHYYSWLNTSALLSVSVSRSVFCALLYSSRFYWECSDRYGVC